MLLRVARPLAVATIVLATSACAPLLTSPGPSVPVESRQPGSASPAEKQSEAEPKKIAPARQTVSPAQRAVSSLLQEGWGYYRQENYQRSIAIAERAQRLDPQRAEVYLLLARSYFAQGQSGLAEQLGQRGLSFSQNDIGIRRQLQSLLAQIHAAVL
ncbi:MAG: tetratricopeptide repeat protein [Gammaproteobacteria bacterium]|nr:tetratricopeptide repeat protein [Gammaproteobacteria bacterium]MBQ0840874.1 tetratricopeptide repeat protein [Gammaproteobacteria bacterium]